jgi:NDP-sugar pyrophosphorylase family protein
MTDSVPPRGVASSHDADLLSDPASQSGARSAPPAGVCAVLLAAGIGRRLRPLTELVPKALCPVGNVPLLDHALRRMAGRGLAGPRHVAVNASYLAAQVVDHVGARAHLSVEPDGPLGTAGGVGNLRTWVDGRAVLVGNADAYLADPARDPGPDIAGLLVGWDGVTVRMLVRAPGPGQRPEFSGQRFAGFSLLPWRYVERLGGEPSDLVREVWRPAEAAGELELIRYDGSYLDTGTPRDYLAANLLAAELSTAHRSAFRVEPPAARPPAAGGGGGGGLMIDPSATVTGPCEAAVVGAGAEVHGKLTRAVVWPGGYVGAGEHLIDAVRVGRDLTVWCV